METVTVSLETLYNKFGEDLCYNEIEKEVDGDIEYFDLYENGLVCMDGETCSVDFKDENKISLINHDGEVDRHFSLSIEEFEYGCFKIKSEF